MLFFSSFCILPQASCFVNNFFRRKNGDGGIRTLAPLLTTYSLSRGAPSTNLGTSPMLELFLKYSILIPWIFRLLQNHPNERREWDSNPRALADKRFSRPPRYDHFDISPCLSDLYILSSSQKNVKGYFQIFLFFLN